MAFETKIRVRLVIVHKKQLLLEYVTDEDFYFYPGGKVENFETVVTAAEREMKEELDAEFVFKKVLYIREFIQPENEEHSMELYILGDLNNYDVSKNMHDPDYKHNHEFVWVDIDKLPKNLYPVSLTSKLVRDYKNGFPNQGEYLGAVE